MRKSKYSQLNDSSWLRTKYETKKGSLSKIALEVGCDRNSIKNALIKHGISLRIKKPHKFYEKLYDYGWLYDSYIVHELSLCQIAADLGNTKDYSRVRAALVKFNIPLRKKGAAQRLWHRQQGVEDYFLFDGSVITGCLLGDGGFRVMNAKSDDSCPSFGKGNKNYDHVLYVANLVFLKNGELRILECANNTGFNAHKEGKMFRFSTLTYPCLLPWYRSWYPAWNDYKKVIPRQHLKLDRVALLHWFLDDGYSYRVKCKKRYSYVRVQFATECFNKDDLEWLSSEIFKILGVRIVPRFHQRNGEIRGTGWEMHVQQADVSKFFEVIGPCPVPSLAYKWKIPS